MKIYFIFFLILLISCSTPKAPKLVWCADSLETSDVVSKSFKDLYNSKDIEGKKISIEGLFSYNFEDIALYPNNSNQKGVWLSFNNELLPNDSLLSKLKGKKIIVTGTVDLSRKGHLGSYFCTLYNISCIKQ